MKLPRVVKTENLAPVMVQRALVHERAAAFVEAEFPRRGTVPYLWVIGIGSEIHYLETPWETEPEKAAYTRVVAAALEIKRAHCYAFIGEAWIAVYDADEHGKLPADHCMPSEKPEHERDDVVMIVSEDRAGGQAMTRYLVTMRPHGKNLLGPRVDEPDHFYAGTLFNMFRSGNKARQQRGE